jgi:uncharacterized membrane protein
MAARGISLCRLRGLTAIFAKVGVENVNSDYKLSVVLVALFAVLFLGERLSAPNWLGVSLIGAGAILVAYKG